MITRYWFAECLDGSDENIRDLTRSNVAELKQRLGAKRYGPVHLVTTPDHPTRLTLLDEALGASVAPWERPR